MKLGNLIKALKDQLPLKRAFRNFFITGNAWGMFSKYSHINKEGKKKVSYNRRSSAESAAAKMKSKNGFHYSVYKCVFCDGYHIGRNRSSIKIKENEN
jgi:hypothetical protein